MSPFRRLPTELIIAIATLLDARSLVYFKLTCKSFRDIVDQTPCLQYALALAAHGLCDGPPSPVTVASRLELVEAYDEAWRTFSWSKHLTLDLPPHKGQYISGGTLVLPIYEIGGAVRSFLMQTIPSPLRGVPERRWRIDLDVNVMYFVSDATQDLLAVVPMHGSSTTFIILVLALSTGQPHPLAANRGILHPEASQYPFPGYSKYEICGDFLGMITRSGTLGNCLLIWNWRTGVLHVNMPIRMGSPLDAAFSFLDDRHFVVPSAQLESSGVISLYVYRLGSDLIPQHTSGGQQRVQVPSPELLRSYVLSFSNVLEDICALRFFQDVSARGGAASPPGHFCADASKRVFGIKFGATFLSTERETVQELLIPIRALYAPTRELPYRRTSVSYEPFINPQLAYAFRAATVAGEGWRSMPPEKLPPALRAVDACQLRYAVCCGALLVFEIASEDLWSPRRLHILAF